MKKGCKKDSLGFDDVDEFWNDTQVNMSTSKSFTKASRQTHLFMNGNMDTSCELLLLIGLLDCWCN